MLVKEKYLLLAHFSTYSVHPSNFNYAVLCHRDNLRDTSKVLRNCPPPYRENVRTIGWSSKTVLSHVNAKEELDLVFSTNFD